MKRSRFLMVLLALAGIGQIGAAPASAAPADVAPAAQLHRGREAMADLGQRLKAALVQKLQAEGPVAAVNFCHEEAPRIAATVAQEHGVALGRTAVRHRSPANAPNEWQQAVLEAFLRQSGTTPPAHLTFSASHDGVLRMAKGIATEAPCLACHGAQIAEPVRAAIRAHYPEDAATGFAEGELRGMFWVEVPPMKKGD